MTDRKCVDATGKVPDRSLHTTTQYRRRGWKFVAQIRRELGDPNASLSKVVDVFMASDLRYKSTSQRTIKAWLLQVVDDARLANPDNNELAGLTQKLLAGCGPVLVAELHSSLGGDEVKIEDIVGAFLSADRKYSVRAQNTMIQYLGKMIDLCLLSGALSRTDGQVLLTELEGSRPKPRAGRRAKNTSAKKRKEVPFDELQPVIKYLTATEDKLNVAAAAYLKLNIFLGLRPGEWRSAYLEGRSFHWKAEKTSNGRGNTTSPTVQLQSAERWTGTLRWFLDFLKPYSDNEKEWSRLFECLRSRIAYACNKVGIVRISLYTTRDVFIATELLIGTDPAVVAAKVNHKSVRMQRRHYSTKKSGYEISYSLTAVDQSLVASVTPIEPFSIDKLSGSEPQLRA